MVPEFDLVLLYLQKIRWKIIFHVFSSLHLFQSQLTANLFSETDLETESLAGSWRLEWVMEVRGGKPMVANKSRLEQWKKTWLFSLYRGLYYPVILGAYFIRQLIRIPGSTKQDDSMECRGWFLQLQVLHLASLLFSTLELQVDWVDCPTTSRRLIPNEMYFFFNSKVFVVRDLYVFFPIFQWDEGRLVDVVSKFNRCKMPNVFGWITLIWLQETMDWDWCYHPVTPRQLIVTWSFGQWQSRYNDASTKWKRPSETCSSETYLLVGSCVTVVMFLLGRWRCLRAYALLWYIYDPLRTWVKCLNRKLTLKDVTWCEKLKIDTMTMSYLGYGAWGWRI